MASGIRGATALIATLLASAAGGQTAPAARIPAATPGADALAEGFRDPPVSARPRVWWHWLNGNISEDGIAKDLDWMKRIGLGGVQTFDASMGAPPIVPAPLAYMTPAWKQAFRAAAVRADRLGLELGIAASPGWSETGGPWVPPADGMKKLVWSQTDIVGGRRFAGRLAAPPSTTGAFQDAAIADEHAALEAGAKATPSFYADSAVIAFPVAAARAPALPVAATLAGEPIAGAALADGRLATTIGVPRGTPAAPGGMMLSYPRAETIRSATLFVPDAVPPFGDPEFLPVLEARVGGAWKRIAALPLAGVPTTVSFAPVTAREFRVTLPPNTATRRVGLAAPAPGAVMVDIFGRKPPAPMVPVGEFRLGADAQVDRFEVKAAFATVPDYAALASPADAAGVDPARVVDLTARMRPDGSLDWTPPRGRWRVLRMGYSLTGKSNHPAVPEATGLEVDKYDGAAVRRYLATYLGMYRDAAGPGMFGGAGLRALVTDSIEAGDSNWTPGLVQAFRERRGYDPVPYLPALTGAIVGTAAASDAFLYDYRRTLADLIASEHYGTVAQVAKEQGLTLYGEALENGRPLLGDDMAMRARTDVPMAAMWTFGRGEAPRPTLIGDIRGAASVAHVYGQNIVAAESLTSSFSPWAFAPADLKRVIDLEFALGVNRPVIHTSVHQPVDDKVPGLSLAIFGQYLNRHETWAEMARPWIDYIARSSFLLQQGRSVADVAYFYGEDTPLTALYAQAPLADVPTRYGYDFVDAGALAGQLSVEGGRIVSRSGQSYRVLYLGAATARMTLPVLRRIAALVEAGATVVGTAPAGTPALGDDAAAHAALVRRLWGGGAVTMVGQGRVIAGRDVEAALAGLAVPPDFATSSRRADTDLPFVHRRLADGDAYFVLNRRNRAETVDARFRVTGRRPELWHADTGRITPVSYRIEGDTTVVPLDLAAEDAVFVMFRRPASAPAETVPASAPQPAATVAGPWTVAFQPGRGAPASMRMAALAPLDASTVPGIRYFSGVATYSTEVTLTRAQAAAPLTLDLGEVGDVAEVRVNGRPVGTAWHAPFRVDLGDAARPGRNRIEVRVANLWVNRLIGDAQPGAVKTTFTSLPAYRPDAPLRRSGLIGPVTIAAGR